MTFTERIPDPVQRIVILAVGSVMLLTFAVLGASGSLAAPFYYSGPPVQPVSMGWPVTLWLVLVVLLGWQSEASRNAKMHRRLCRATLAVGLAGPVLLAGAFFVLGFVAGGQPVSRYYQAQGSGMLFFGWAVMTMFILSRCPKAKANEPKQLCL